MSTDPMPVYGTPDGEPLDTSSPAYGTPDPLMPSLPDRPRVARRRFLAERAFRRLRRIIGRAFGRSELDWGLYPGLVAGDSNRVLDGIRLDEVLARNDRVLSRIRRALEVEFRVHWWENSDRETLAEQWNSWGGASLLKTAHSSVWRTTSGLTSGEDRDMAARIVGVALTHEGFAHQQLERSDDHWVLTARSEQSPESVVVLLLGFSEFELTLDSSAILAAEDEVEFRRRAAPFLQNDA